jgi:hypothetical protein
LGKLQLSASVENKISINGDISGELLELHFPGIDLDQFRRWAAESGIPLEQRNIFSNMESVPAHWRIPSGDTCLSGFILIGNDLESVFIVTQSIDKKSLVGYFYCFYKK